MKVNKIKTGIETLTVFSALKNDCVINALHGLLAEPSPEKYSDFVSLLYSENDGALDKYINQLCEKADNFYIRACACGKSIPDYIQKSVDRELEILQKLADIDSAELQTITDCGLALASFSSGNTDIISSFKERMRNLGKYGYGIFATHHMFCVDDDGKIIPVQHPDEVKLSDLIGYTEQRNKIIPNTKALLMGKPAANTLLTGDAGTGKSSTVKAVVNEFWEDGLRIIEIRKDQITKLGRILDELSENPLKFIIFIDDISFNECDNSFSQLKAILEGSVSSRSKNVVIYATSNRLHAVNERFSDRNGDEIHRNDTIQELMSFSGRFGLHITFGKPDKATYIKIVSILAKNAGINIPEAELDLLAERFALERGGRSARLARQFVDSLLSK